MGSPSEMLVMEAMRVATDLHSEASTTFEVRQPEAVPSASHTTGMRTAVQLQLYSKCVKRTTNCISIY